MKTWYKAYGDSSEEIGQIVAFSKRHPQEVFSDAKKKFPIVTQCSQIEAEYHKWDNHIPVESESFVALVKPIKKR